MRKNFYEKYMNRVRPSLPKYMQLRDIIATAIEEGFWGLGAQIPGEADIAKLTSFSLGTVQKALKLLDEEGIIERKQGYGTFVSRNAFSPQHCRFVIEGKEDFFRIRPIIVGRKVISSERGWVRHIAPGGEDLLQIDREINVGNQFKLYNKFYINKERFSMLWSVSIKKLNGINLKAFLKNNYDILITHTSNFVSINEFPEHICKSLGLNPCSHGLLFEVLAMAGPKNPIYFSEFYIPLSSWKLYVSDLNHPPYFWID